MSLVSTRPFVVPCILDNGVENTCLVAYREWMLRKSSGRVSRCFRHGHWVAALGCFPCPRSVWAFGDRQVACAIR
jgi:hypothetical protein